MSIDHRDSAGPGATTLWQFEASGPAEALDDAYRRATDSDPPLGVSASLFDDGPGRRRLELLFDGQPDAVAVRDALGLDADAEVSFGPLAARDWVALSLEGLPPVDAGRFRLRGSHDAPADGGRIDLLIDANEAFGTGHHGTTKGCLLALDELLGGWTPRTALDVGTGSGALAIAYAKAAGAPILATDIDPIATRVATANAELNGVGALVTAVTADGFDHPDLAGRAFDLIFANILAAPLIALAGDLAGALAPGGRAILSGLLVDQETAVAAAYAARGLKVERRPPLQEWATLVLSW